MSRPNPTPIPADKLRTTCPAEALAFGDTRDLEPLVGTVGQSRALEALEVGIGIRREGYNIFIMGSTGVGKHTVAHEALRRRAATEPVPPDLVYVANFDDPHRPRALRLQPGGGAKLRDVMDRLVEDLGSLLPAVFTSDRYTARARKIAEAMEKVQDQALAALRTTAIQKGLLMKETEDGLTFGPAKGEDELLGPDEFTKLPTDEQKALADAMDEMQEQLQGFAAGVPRWRKETRERLKALDQEVSREEVTRLMDPLLKLYAEDEEVRTWLEAVREDVVEQAHIFRDEEEEDEEGEVQLMPQEPVSMRRYAVNVLVDHGKTEGAPVIYEDNPVFTNIIGRIEHVSEYGALTTDHTLIKPGALHQASGGYLILDAHRLLVEPYGWTALKRALRSRLLRMDSPAQTGSLMTTVSLAPEPLPIDVKVVMMGSPSLYYELCAGEPEFERHFKILAAFEDHIPRNVENTRLYARLIGTKAADEGLKPFTSGAVGEIIEYSAREVEDAEQLSANLSGLFNLMDEADYWADKAGHEVVERADVRQALDAFIRRSSRPRDDLHESIERGTLMVATEGDAIGQINGLAVMGLGNVAFGRPTRITATARMGTGEVIDIEREAELAGSIHSKGVLILQSLLGSRYATDVPLSLTASLVFEQSYGLVEGDSASLSEYCALLSAVGRIPIKQSLAVTGSINQHGQVQAIGGVNEKIEGFFDVCQVRGLTGEQGVIIPTANVKNLMLRSDVVEACRAGRFSVWAVDNVEPALALLTGLPAGVRGADGHYPEGSVNGKVETGLRGFFERRRALAAELRPLSHDI
ncbi:MAG: ATP-binding protein [Deltaproteobacteria bacterium]|nr:MAG: ATP-binding protein [Deltaproteobacteria bacterium]